MILDRLILKNFKRFRDEEIRFKDGITGILGNNGAGKSSLVQAVFFALYGVQATGISGDYIVSSFAGPKEKCEVRLDFRIGGDSYTVVRTFKKGKTVSHDATFHQNGKLLATGVSPVEEAVKRALGMGPVDFRNTIYAAQKDLLTLLENTPGKRKEWFLRALGIDYLKAESEKALKEEIDRKNAGLQKMTGQLEALSDRLGEEEPAKLETAAAGHRALIAELEQARETQQKERDGLATRQKLLAEQRLAYTGLLRQQESLVRERNVDREQVKALEAQIALVAEEQAEYDRLKPVMESYDSVRQRMEALRQKKEKYQQLKAELGFAITIVDDLIQREEARQIQLEDLDGDSRQREVLISAIRTGLGAGDVPEERLETAVNFRLAEISRQGGTLAARLAHYQKEREKIAADRETIRQAGTDGICPLCRQKLGEHFGSIEAEFSARIRELEERAVADLEKRENLNREKAGIEALKPSLDLIRALDANLKQKPVYEQELAALAAQRKIHEKDEHRIRNSLMGLMFDEEEFSACEKESAGLQDMQHRFIGLGKKIGQGLMARQHLDALRGKIERRTEELRTLEESARALAFDPGEAAGIEDAIASADTILRTVEIRIANAIKDLRFTEERIAEYNRAQEQVAGLQKQIAEREEEIDLLAKTRKLIAEYVVYLLQVVRSRLEGETSRIIGEITAGRYEQVLLDEDFNLLVRDVDNDYPVDRFSGGEQDDIAVALRIALSRYLAELHHVHESTFLIFDEIFGSQDEERRSSLLTALRTQESRFPQILLISHIAEIQGEFANTLVVETVGGEGSHVRDVA